MDLQMLIRELNDQKYSYDIINHNTINIKLNSIKNNMIILSYERCYLIIDTEYLLNIHFTIPKNIKFLPATNYAIFTIKNKQSIIDSYLDLTYLYYEIQHLKNDSINK